jgi:hypothetical protein
MRKTIHTLFFGSLLFIGGSILLTSSSNGRAFAANDGNTGAPGEGQTCRSCHGGGFGTTVSITLKDSTGFPVTDYIPGNVYDVDVSINTTGTAQRYGFQMVTLTSNAIPYNAWSQPSANTRIASAGQRDYAEHRGKSTTSSFSTKWTAPVAGTGDIVFYAGGAAVNNDGSTSGDGGNTTSLTISEDISTSISAFSLTEKLVFFPNPVEDQLLIKNTHSELLVGLIRIIDLNGKLISEQSLTVESNKQNVLDLSSLKAGVYMAQIITNNQGSASKRIVVK